MGVRVRWWCVKRAHHQQPFGKNPLHVLVAKSYPLLAMDQMSFIAIKTRAHVVNGKPPFDSVAPDMLENLLPT
jgi:hypothetical protein